MLRLVLMAVFKKRKKEKAEDKKLLAHSRSDYGTFAQCRGEKIKG